jgi:hypothetical protein
LCLRGSKVQYLLQWYVLTKVLGTEYGLCMVVLLLPLVFFKTKCLSLYTYYCTYLAMNKLPRTPTHNYCPLLTLELRTLAVLLMSNKLIKLSSHLFNLWGDISYQEGAVTRYKFYNVFGHMSCHGSREDPYKACKGKRMVMLSLSPAASLSHSLSI